MTFTKLLAFTKDVSDLPDKPSLTPTELKAQFDAAPDEVRVYLNQLIDALKLTTAGDSGAKNIGATTISGLTGNDLQTLLESLNTNKANKTQESLINMTLENGWVNYQAGQEGVYYKDELGRVYISGRFKNGSTTDGFLLTSLPTGYKPVKDYLFRARNCEVLIAKDGFVKLYSVTNAGDIGIDGLNFRAQ